MTALVRAKGLRLHTADGSVVADGPLEVRAGEVVAVLGPNGAGKTTLLLALAGLREPDEGEVTITGRPGYLPQQPVLFAGTALRNVALPLRIAGSPRAEARRRAMESMSLVGAEHLAGRRASGLSGGEARRLALARVLVTHPDVLLLDEPFGGLDAPGRERLLADAAPLLRDGGRATVVVTHDRDEAVALADWVLVMVDGELRQAGDLADVFSRPADPDVARVVGADNLLSGVVGRSEGVLEVRCGSLLLSAVGDADVGDPVICAIRPDGIVVHPPEDPAAGSARNRIPAVVGAVERRASSVRVVADASGERLVASVLPSTAQDMGLGPGVPVVLAIKATGVHVIRRS